MVRMNIPHEETDDDDDHQHHEEVIGVIIQGDMPDFLKQIMFDEMIMKAMYKSLLNMSDREWSDVKELIDATREVRKEEAEDGKSD